MSSPLLEARRGDSSKVAGRYPGATIADPMCGSGTLLIEAALMARNVAPGLFRREWPFEQWPDFDPAAWEQAQVGAGTPPPPPPPQI